MRTAEKEFVVDIPPYILDEVGVWHHVAATWSPKKGLTIYSKGMHLHVEHNTGEGRAKLPQFSKSKA